MKKLLSLFIAVLVSVGLTSGLVAANSGSIDTTGADSDNWVHFEDESDVSVDNTTSVDATVSTDQDADSGDADVKYNTTGGDAMSGDAMNETSLEADLTIDNSGSSSALECACTSSDNNGTVENTGYNSNNHILFNNSSTVNVTNDTDVNLDSTVDQDADSGDASVLYNTTGGNATSGSASNSSSTVFSLSVTN